jgi:hypothetical protein
MFNSAVAIAVCCAQRTFIFIAAVTPARHKKS